MRSYSSGFEEKLLKSIAHRLMLEHLDEVYAYG